MTTVDTTCERTWRVWGSVNEAGDKYRQHRCGVALGDGRHTCVCRYCGERR